MAALIKSLLVLLFALEIAVAFNSERLATTDGHQKPHHGHQHQHHEKTRHERRQVQQQPADLSAEVMDIFQNEQNAAPSASAKQKRQLAFPIGFPFSSYLQSTLVPNGHQINNYYPPPSQPFIQQPFWPQQQQQFGLGYPVYVPVLVPVYINNGCTTARPNITLEDRFNFPDDPIVLQNQNPNQNEIFNQRPMPMPMPRPPPQPRPPVVERPQEEETLTGISLQPIGPSRPQSRPPPPLYHNSGSGAQGQSAPAAESDNLNKIYDAENDGRDSRPQYQQRPQVQPQPRPQQPQTQRPPLTGCAGAVQSCCSSNLNQRQRANCFGQFSCPVWGSNPCDAIRATRRN